MTEVARKAARVSLRSTALIAVAALAAASAQATDYYISSSEGDDSNTSNFPT